jgi:hypothetical protein
MRKLLIAGLLATSILGLGSLAIASKAGDPLVMHRFLAILMQDAPEIFAAMDSVAPETSPIPPRKPGGRP